MTDIINDIIKKHYEELQEKKTQLIKDFLIKNGFDEYTNFKQTRFPKVACVKIEDWEYWYADDGTTLGKFIVAIKEFDTPTIVDQPEKNGYKLEINFKYQDNFEPAELRLGLDFI